MPYPLFSLLLLTFGLTSYSQTISVDTLFIPNQEISSNIPPKKLKFPIIKTGNQRIENKINTDIKNRFTNNEYIDFATDSTLIKWSKDGINELDFEVTYLKNDIVSFNISAEGCGAYCTQWTEYFTYNCKTGYYITIDQVIDTTGNFKQRVLSDKDKQYAQQALELKEKLTNENNEFDSETYNSVMDNYRSCAQAFHLNTFALHKDHIEIIQKCWLPHVIASLTPTIELKYKYSDIKADLRIKLLNSY
jgi:hypothetical protein